MTVHAHDTRPEDPGRLAPWKTMCGRTVYGAGYLDAEHILTTATKADDREPIYADTWDDYCTPCRNEAQRRTEQE